MLSILIPIYQENCVKLIHDLVEQANKLTCDYEILVFDDCSPLIPQENKVLSQIPKVEYKELEENLGRSKIRNYLSDCANGDILLFLDGDSGIVRDDFLKKYLREIEKYDIVRGGTVYCSKDKMPKGCDLHWKYGTKVESNKGLKNKDMFTTNNFCIRKSVFSKVRFREDINGYGHEDTLFKFDLEAHSFSFCNIDNPVEHLGLKTFEQFIKSTESAVVNLKKLNQRNKNLIQRIKLVKAYNKLSKLGLEKLYSRFFLMTRKMMLNLLATKNPNLLILNLYKLGIYTIS